MIISKINYSLHAEVGNRVPSFHVGYPADVADAADALSVVAVAAAVELVIVAAVVGLIAAELPDELLLTVAVVGELKLDLLAALPVNFDPAGFAEYLLNWV